MRSGLRAADGAPDRVDHLDALRRCVDDLERGDVVERVRVRPALAGAQFVEHPVLRHLEEPGREAAAQGEAREAVVDPQEDVLREVLGQHAIADDAQDVVEDRRLVGRHERCERARVALLRSPKSRELGLRQWHGARLARGAGIARVARVYRRTRGSRTGSDYAPDTKLRPVIPRGWSSPSSARQVGATSARPPPSRRARPGRRDDERHRIRRVRRVRAPAVRLQQLLGVAVVGEDEAHAAGALEPTRSPGRGTHRRPRPPHDRGNHPRVPDHVGVREVDDREAVRRGTAPPRRSAGRPPARTSRASGRTSPRPWARGRARRVSPGHSCSRPPFRK